MRNGGNTVLITGGATGIGLALALELVQRGDEVIVCGRRRERLAAAKEREPRLHVRVADVARSAAREELALWAIRQFPRLNALVNNAGVQHRVAFAEGTRDLVKADEEIATNLTAPIHLTALFLDHLRAQPEAAIVNVTSGLAFAPLAHMPVYCATKAAMHSLTMSLRHQLRDTSVRVFEIIPPIVATELGADHRPPQMNETAMTAETTARLTVEALERDELEAPLGEAARLREKRESLFGVMNR